MESRRGRPPHPGVVTPAEEKVLRLVRDGLTNGEIAERLGLTLNTVKYHVGNLLAKADAASREELAAWRASSGRSLFGLALPATRWMWAGLGGAAAGAAGVAVLALALSFRGGAETKATPVARVDAVATATAVGPTGPPIPPDRVKHIDTVAVVVGYGEFAVSIVDTRTGATLTSLETAYNPLVTFRRQHDELLLTHQPGTSHVLDVLDLSDGLALKRRVEIPDRPNYKVSPGGAWQALSGDERYFAVYSWDLRTELPECQLSPADGPSCTRSRVRIIDLADAASTERLYELPRHCFGGLIPHGPTAFIATCNDGYYLLEGSAPLPTAAGPEPRFLTDPVQARNLASGMLWLSPGDGWYGALMQEGSFAWSKAGQAEVGSKALPAGMQLRWPIFAEIGGGRLVAGYIERYYDQYPAGLAVYNLTTLQLEKEMPAFGIGRSMVAGGPDELLATTTDGRLIAITVSTGAERTIAKLSANTEVAFLVR